MTEPEHPPEPTSPSETSPPPEYKTLAHFALAFGVTVMLFAIALSTIITLVFFGWKILVHGIPMCATLAQNNLFTLDVILYNACGCSLVSIILITLSTPIVLLTFPRLIKQMKYARRMGLRGR